MAKSITPYFVIGRFAITGGADDELVIPTGTRELTLLAETAAVTLRDAAGATPYFIVAAGASVTLNDANLAGCSLYCTGTAATYLAYIAHKGIG